MAREQLFGELAAFRRPLATPKCVERQCGRRVRRSVHQCCLARASLDNHAAAGGTHHQVQVRAILGGSQRGENPVQRRQICGIDLLSPGPGAQGPAGRRVEVPASVPAQWTFGRCGSSHRELPEAPSC